MNSAAPVQDSVHPKCTFKAQCFHKTVGAFNCTNSISYNSEYYSKVQMAVSVKLNFTILQSHMNIFIMLQTGLQNMERILQQEDH